jgi:methyl-accepting chemotaxis protein
MAFGKTQTLQTKMLLLPLLFAVGMILMSGASYIVKDLIIERVIYPQFEAVVLKGNKALLKAAVTAEAQHLALTVADKNTRQEKIDAIVKATEPVRFFDDKSGYFFSYDTKGVRICVPTSKAGRGESFWDLKDVKGNLLVQDLVKAAQGGGGFTYYYFEKPGAGVQPKLAYAAMIPGTDFFVGAGVYIDNVEKERAALQKEVESKLDYYMILEIILGLAILALIVIFSILSARRIAVMIRRVVQGLTQVSENISMGAEQVAKSGQVMASSASQQAASIEETSASLEELSSQTRLNADNAQEANKLTSSANDVVGRANDSMHSLTDSFQHINTSSEEVAKIIKTIDEIAFQTNLLALNAAVEAARAGEAGAGFAVVADEVRSLAMRAAEAARNTAELIDDTVNKIHAGSGQVEEVNQSFGGVTSSVGKVGSLIGEISTASDEQAQGIDQIKQAVNQMEQTTQNYASMAEETASSSEEMNGQAAIMNGLVEDLFHLVGGAGAKSPSGQSGHKKQLEYKDDE